MTDFHNLNMEECMKELINAEQRDFETFRITAMNGFEKWKEDYKCFLQ